MITSWYRTAWTSKSCASSTDTAVVENGVSSYRRLSVNTGTSDWNLRLQCNRGSLRCLTGNHRKNVRLQEYKFFNEAACNFKLKSSCKGPVADAKMSENQAAFVRSLKRRTIFQTSISQSMVHKILRSPLRFTSYRYLFSFSFYETKTKKNFAMHFAVTYFQKSKEKE